MPRRRRYCLTDLRAVLETAAEATHRKDEPTRRQAFLQARAILEALAGQSVDRCRYCGKIAFLDDQQVCSNACATGLRLRGG